MDGRIHDGFWIFFDITYLGDALGAFENAIYSTRERKLFYTTPYQSGIREKI